MLRWAMLSVVAMAAIGPVMGADLPNGSRRYHAYPPKVQAEEPDLLFTPSDQVQPRLPETIFGGPLLLGSATLPGYYGSNNTYDYQGPYYGGPNNSFRTRLPYACGVLGYC
jgi:hypothetical protein